MTKFTLKNPIKNGETEIKEINFRELTIGDLIAADSVVGDVAKVVATLALSADLPLPVFKQIGAKELAGIMEHAKDILGN